MEKVAIFFRLREGKREEYESLHANIPNEISAALTEAGISNYTIWRQDDMLFAYYEVEDKERAVEILSRNKAYNEWRKLMRNYVWETSDGQNEWFMENIFSHD